MPKDYLARWIFLFPMKDEREERVLSKSSCHSRWKRKSPFAIREVRHDINKF